MLVKEKLQLNHNFSEVEKTIANFFLEHPDKLEVLTLREMADIIYVAPSSIVRFCKKIGYQGYNHFKENYLNDLKYLSSLFHNIDSNFPFLSTDKNTVLAHKIAKLYQEIIQDCLSLVHHDSLQKAINLLNQSKCIYICTSGVQVELCQIFRNKMLKIGKQVIVHQHAEDIYYDACYCHQDSVFIMISYTGETHKVSTTAPVLQKRQIPMIAVTSYGMNSLSAQTDCCLHVSTRERLRENLGNFGFSLSVMYLLDVLYAGYFNLNYEEHYEYKVYNTKNYEKGERFYGRHTTNSILEDKE